MVLQPNDETDPGQWELVTRILEAALALPEAERTKFVSEFPGSNPQVQQAVQKLLQNLDDAGSFLRDPAWQGDLPLEVQVDTATFQPGDLVAGRFVVVALLGRGGMGEVYEVQDRELGEQLALKTIRADVACDQRYLRRLKQEIQSALQVTHPNVCRVRDIGRHATPARQEITFYTMELLRGKTLAAFLATNAPLKLDAALPILRQIAGGLDAAHRAGIIHRDLKPGNVILVESQAGEPRAVVTDFGLAKPIAGDATVTASGDVVGTLAYMAPEQLQGGVVTPAADIYAFGVIAHEMLTGRRSGEQESKTQSSISSEQSSGRVLLAGKTDRAVSKCLARDSSARFATAQEFVKELAVGSRPSLLATAFRVLRTRRKTVAIAAVAVLLAVSLFVYALRHYLLGGDPRIAEGATVLLAEIRNHTGDPRFDGTTEVMRSQLSQSPHFSLLDAGRIRDVLMQMTKPPDTPLEPAVAREVAWRTGARRVIFGAVSRVGDNYSLDLGIQQPDNTPLRARAHAEHRITWNVPANPSAKEIPSDFLGAVRDGSDWVRQKVGESANDIAQESKPPEDVTTNNWEALSEYTQAEKFMASGQVEGALVALQNAIKADPHFALAYMRLGDVLVATSRDSEGFAAYRAALAEEQQRRLTRREAYRLLGQYSQDTWDFKASEVAFSQYSNYFPHDYLGWFYRGYPLLMLGRVEEAISSLEKAADIDRSRASAPANIAAFELVQGKFEDAKRWTGRVRLLGYGDTAEMLEGSLEFLQEHYDQALAHFARLREAQGAGDRSSGYALAARVLAEQAEYQDALNVLQQGIAADTAGGAVANRADKLLDIAFIDFKLGRYQDCLENSHAALQLDRSLGRSLAAATILGRTAALVSRGAFKTQIRAELEDIERNLPPGDLARVSQVTRARIHGEILLAAGSVQAAVEQFRKANGLEAPIKDREYFARGLLALGKSSQDGANPAKLKQEALEAYSQFALKPGLIWYGPLIFPPGYWLDSVFSYVSLAAAEGKCGETCQFALRQYVNRCAHADRNVVDVDEARKLSQRNEQHEPNPNSN
jgi:tetratricopeptide (TPR) repeat protein